MSQITKSKRKKPNKLRIVLLVAVLFIVLYLLKNTDSLIAAFFGK